MLPAARSALAPTAPGPDASRWRVLGVFPTAMYALSPTSQLLAIVTADGLALPTAWRLPVPSRSIDWGVASGDDLLLAGRDVTLGDNVIRAVRTWRPPRIAPPAPARHTLRLPAAWFEERIGRGPGLTPEGDDEICGALLVACAVGDPRPADVARGLRSRTTAVSAALIEAAEQGYAVPPLLAYARARLAGDERTADATRPAVVSIGHTSGPALVRGVESALEALPARRLPCRPRPKEFIHA